MNVAPRTQPLEREAVSHPIRTPLTVMIGALQSLNRQWNLLSEEKRRERLKMALDAVPAVLEAIEEVEEEISDAHARQPQRAVVIHEEIPTIVME